VLPVTACSIKKVEPVLGLIPKLRFATTLRLDAGPPRERLFIAKWIGEIGFTCHAEDADYPPGPKKLVLNAHWESEPEGSRLLSHSDKPSTFTCDLGPGILDAIERFRDGGRLFARLQGKLQVFFLKAHDAPLESVLTEVLISAGNDRRTLWQELRGDPFELTRDAWCGEILSKLKARRRVVFEATLPEATALEEHGRRALDHLDKADGAFDDGRYEEAVRLAYMAAEALQQLSAAVEKRYGKLAQKSIANQTSALRTLCNPERHDESKVDADGHEIDRLMAMHVLASMRSLAAVYLAAP
jgi:hypothetical protein